MSEQRLSKSEIQQLSNRFGPGDIEFRPGALKKDGTKALALAYITARHVQDRLDEVVPGDWSFNWEPIANSNHPVAKGVLTVKGQSFADCGEAEDADQDSWKSAVSDAFKRCAVQVGIGRYLYALPQRWVACECWPFKQGEKPKFKQWAEDPAGALARQSAPVGPSASRAKPSGEPRQPATDQQVQGDTDSLTCAGCGTPVTQAVKIYSERNYDKCLCRECQGKHEKVAS